MEAVVGGYRPRLLSPLWVGQAFALWGPSVPGTCRQGGRKVVGDSGLGSRSRPLSVRVFPALAGTPLKVGVGCQAAGTFWSGSSI